MKTVYTIIAVAFSMGAMAAPVAEAEPEAEPAAATTTTTVNYGKYAKCVQ